MSLKMVNWTAFIRLSNLAQVARVHLDVSNGIYSRSRYKKNGQVSALEDEDLEGILDSPADERGTIYCYENKE